MHALNTGTAAEGQRPPLAVARDLELHAAADRLRHAEGAAQALHAQGLLGRLPGLEAGFERVARDGRGGLCGQGVWADAVAERVVDAGGGRGGCVGRFEGAGVGGGGDYAHGL